MLEDTGPLLLTVLLLDLIAMVVEVIVIGILATEAFVTVRPQDDIGALQEEEHLPGTEAGGAALGVFHAARLVTVAEQKVAIVGAQPAVVRLLLRE